MTPPRRANATRATPDGRAYLDLRSEAKKAGRATAEYLRLYALEGFLTRLAVSAHARHLVLKGGVLLAAYDLRRPTADIDFAALAQSREVDHVRQLVVDVARTVLSPGQDDGLQFDTSTFTPSPSETRTSTTACESPCALGSPPPRRPFTSMSTSATRYRTQDLGAAEQLVGRHRQLTGAVSRAHPRTGHRHPPAAQGH